MIELKEVTKTYIRPSGGKVTALEKTSFRLEKGEAAALAGYSGSGKTTLLNITAGLLTPDSGSVNVGGADLYAMGETGRDRFRAGNIGYVFQNFYLIPSLSAWENVMAALCFGKSVPVRKRKERCALLLEQMGLKDRMKHRPDQLSGGEQQRVCIARALANHPPVLLADEPTANLDADNRAGVTALLLEACGKEQITLLAATHDPELLAALPRVIRLQPGNKEKEPALCF